MKILVVGSGGREHAIIDALSKSALKPCLYCAPGNAGIERQAKCLSVAATDIEGMIDAVRTEGIDYVVVAPDDPLAMGMVDALKAEGIAAFGPAKAAARLESSKMFAKEFMQRNGIPTARYAAFDDAGKAMEYIRSMPDGLVVKADGLALGKGVYVAGTRSEAETAIRELMLEGRHGHAGVRVIIEELLEGRELTVLAFTDGRTVKTMPAARDHKRAYDGDEGPNTGGMGVISPVADYTPELERRCIEEVIEPTIRAMREEGCPFSGVIYFELMLTAEGPKVIEYNARFGDPEAQAILPRLKTDLLEIFLAVSEGRLESLDIEWDGRASCAVVMASGGYPGEYERGFPVEGIELAEEDAFVYAAGLARGAEGLVTSGGRVLCVTALGDDVEQARSKAYAAVGKISFKNAHYRKDIGGK